ncbi:MAG: polyhydroxyalkanoic acid system family protein, partial [Myxococcaceae bacterium]
AVRDRMHFSIPHSLPIPKALRRVELLTSYWSEKYGVTARWSGQTAELQGHIFGMNLDAHLEVTDTKVGGDVSDPGFLMRGTARNYLQRKFSTYLDPKNNW